MSEELKLKLVGLMKLWQEQQIDEKDVHRIAEELWDEQEWGPYSESDTRSIAVEVLSYLDVLNHILITAEDIPTIINFLKTASGNEVQGWQVWKEYWSKIDIHQRKENLKSNPYYHTHSIAKL